MGAAFRLFLLVEARQYWYFDVIPSHFCEKSAFSCGYKKQIPHPKSRVRNDSEGLSLALHLAMCLPNPKLIQNRILHIATWITIRALHLSGCDA
jgi:hypothetical protein